MAACPKCGGSGILECHRCKGTGKAPKLDSDLAVNLSNSPNASPERCPSCHGVGSETCSRCDGSGVVHC